MGRKKDELYQIATRNLGLVEVGSGIDGFQLSVSRNLRTQRLLKKEEWRVWLIAFKASRNGHLYIEPHDQRRTTKGHEEDIRDAHELDVMKVVEMVRMASGPQFGDGVKVSELESESE